MSKHSSRPYRDLSPQEAEQLRELKEHPGWSIFVTRLHWTQAEVLQYYLDSNDQGFLGEFRGLKRAEALADWAIAEAYPEKVKRGDFTPPYEGVTAEDIQNLVLKEPKDAT